MINLINIKNDKRLNAKMIVHNYLSPDYVYIPYEKDFKINVKTKEAIYKDSIVASTDAKFMYSPVSGTVLGLSEMLVNNKKTKVIVIENDFKEKVKKIKGIKKYINNYSKEEVIDILRLFNIKFDKLDGKMLLINGLDEEIYEKSRSATIKKYINEILDTIDALYDIFNCEKCYFAIKNNDSDNVDALIHHIGTYPNIDLKMMPDLYPLGHKDILEEELIISKNKDLGVIYFTVEEIYNIYNVLKRQRPVTEKFITISGDMVKTPKIINVKIGTSIRDIINNNIIVDGEVTNVIINGLLSGYASSLDLIITPDINSIFIHAKSIIHETDCINCGMCHTKCPVGVDPRTKYKIDNCIKCGVCTYICPAKINFKKVVNK